MNKVIVYGLLVFSFATGFAANKLDNRGVSKVSDSVTNIDFLAKNQANSDVQVMDNGLQYRIDQVGEGEMPAATDEVTVMYEGKLVDGTVFDSSYARKQPATFKVNQVIQGWQIALQKMPVGSTWTLYIPADLAYGERGVPGVIPPNSVLIFKVELQAISK